MGLIENISKALAIVACVVLLPAGAQAACSWDVSGEWIIYQTNGFTISMNLHQNGSALTGSAIGSEVRGDCWKTATCQQKAVSADGSIKGDAFEVTAYWGPNVIGVYRGKVNPQGRLEGDTFDKRNPKSTALWHSNRTAKCVSSAQFEYDTDRPGRDIRNFIVGRGDITACQSACQADSKCRAWTYVKPNIQGPNAKCWLKHGVPGPRKGTCCVSGVK